MFKKWMNWPGAAVLGRALFAAIFVLLSLLQSDTSWSGSLLRAGIVAAALAFVETARPITDFVSQNVRAILGALFAGVAVLLTQLSTDTAWTSSLIRGAIVAGLLAALQYATPVNPTVGVFKLVLKKPQSRRR